MAYICSFIRKTAALSMSNHVDITSYWDHTWNAKFEKCHHHLHHQVEYWCSFSHTLSFALLFAHFQHRTSYFYPHKICKTFWQTDNQLIVIFCRHHDKQNISASFGLVSIIYDPNDIYSTFYLLFTFRLNRFYVSIKYQMWTHTRRHTCKRTNNRHECFMAYTRRKKIYHFNYAL